MVFNIHEKHAMSPETQHPICEQRLASCTEAPSLLSLPCEVQVKTFKHLHYRDLRSLMLAHSSLLDTVNNLVLVEYYAFLTTTNRCPPRIVFAHSSDVRTSLDNNFHASMTMKSARLVAKDPEVSNDDAEALSSATAGSDHTHLSYVLMPSISTRWSGWYPTMFFAKTTT